MPEGLEAEIWRSAIEVIVGRTIETAWVDERVAAPGFGAAITDTTITGVRRAGKIVLVDTDGPTIGLHFGMTGRVVIDGAAPIARLQYASARDDPEWDRLRVFAGGEIPAIRFNDPRRLGRLSLDPDVSALGVDFTSVTGIRLARAIAGRRSAIKTVLLDQTVIAGLGNLCADEVLWWAGVDPRRTADTLDTAEVDRLANTIRRRLAIMLRRGGSHRGTLSPAVRARCPPCDRDGEPLRRETIGGRTAVWCSRHQR
ncbi:MAG TPA: DNA-formamidopyrimidine glycosylase family protein [Ilumatobacteraceae bacterium]|nr:DNA-formamidopyrimidine glycosylase family protein [Ilumatobacteraceae bacterium]